MAAYIVGRMDVTDWDKYREYTKVTPGIIEKYEGKFMVRGGDMVTLEGPEESQRIVLLEFPTFEKAKAFYISPEYQEARKLRAGAATGQLIAIKGAE
jgi:uncharacterized protein (DUF1330 family)